MKPLRIHIAKEFLISIFTICLLVVLDMSVNAQKKVVFDNPVLYQGFPIDTGDVITIKSIDSSGGGVSGSAANNNFLPIEIDLTGDVDYDLKANYNNLILTFGNASREYCISRTVEFEVDEANSTADILHISSCSFINQFFYYGASNICQGKFLLEPTTNIPLESINLLTSSNITFDSELNILPYQSAVDVHMIIIESEYCIERGHDTLYMDIAPASTELLVDNLKTCPNIGGANLDISNYDIYSTTDRELIEDIPQSGEYLVQLKGEVCAAINTVRIDLVETPEIRIVQEELCDKVILSVESTSDITAYNWWSGASTATENIVESGFAWIEVVDENNCLAYDTADIEFSPFKVESVDYSTIDATCFEDGVIEINNVEVDSDHILDSYVIQNDIDESFLADLNNVPEGIYEIEALAMNGCIAYSDIDITVLQTCLEEYPAFTPDGDGIEDDYFIPYEGEVKIYNRAGMLMISIPTPNYWDGKDDLGKTLPMGNYVMITDKGKAVNITIVR